MDALSYVNIFETKGLEYLLVISFLIGFMLFVRYVTSTPVRSVIPAAGVAVGLANENVACLAEFECPYRKVVENAVAQVETLEEEEGAA